ncbi:hypothetical protein HDV06_001081 [Boothiomyces sp. JEL0866]|nr:hypothetical protein HDV06_001081 [Boothiomyces sp. JEL0866]
MNNQVKAYKYHTDQFVNWLSAITKKPVKGTRAITKAVKTVLKRGIQVPQKIMNSLEQSIYLRTSVCRLFAANCKDSTRHLHHCYFLELLRKSKNKLYSHDRCQPSVNNPGSQTLVNPLDAKDNIYEYLPIDDLPEFDKRPLFDKLPVFENTIPVCKQTKRKRRKAKADAIGDYQVERLLAFVFLVNVHKVLSYVTQVWGRYKAGQVSLLSATAVTNCAITTVDRNANILSFKYPNLRSMEYIWIVVEYSDLIEWVKTKYPQIKHSLVLEIIAQSFRKYDKVPFSGLNKYLAKKSNLSNNELIALLQSLSTVKPQSSILNWSGLIAGRNSILNTAIVFSAFVDHFGYANTNLFWANDCDNSFDSAPTAVSDLYNYLLNDFLECVFWDVKFKKRLTSNEKHLIPLFTLYRNYLSKKEGGIALVFGLHAMLHSIVIVQGNLTRHRYSLISEAFSDFSLKLDHPPCTVASGMVKYMDFSEQALYFTHIDKEIHCEYNNEIFLNPYMSGQFLSVICMDFSIDFGLNSILNFKKVILIIHWYNALLVLHLIPRIKVLEDLITLFAKSNSLFVGGRPTRKGQFADCCTRSIFMRKENVEIEKLFSSYSVMVKGRLPAKDSRANTLEQVLESMESEKKYHQLDLMYIFSALNMTFKKLLVGLEFPVETDYLSRETQQGFYLMVLFIRICDEGRLARGEIGILYQICLTIQCEMDQDFSTRLGFLFLDAHQ